MENTSPEGSYKLCLVICVDRLEVILISILPTFMTCLANKSCEAIGCDFGRSITQFISGNTANKKTHRRNMLCVFLLVFSIVNLYLKHILNGLLFDLLLAFFSPTSESVNFFVYFLPIQQQNILTGSFEKYDTYIFSKIINSCSYKFFLSTFPF